MNKLGFIFFSRLIFFCMVTIISCDSEEVDCQNTVWYQDLDKDGLGNSGVTLESCEQPSGYVADNTDTNDGAVIGEGSEVTVYSGTGAITQGLGVTTNANLFSQGVRKSPIGTITSIDNQTWTVPADVNYGNDSFSFIPDLNNAYGKTYSSFSEASINYDSEDVVEIDDQGALITIVIFADNYFEMYINGVFIGKDAVPFTEFNSHIVKVRVARPFTVAMLLVDWEENLGLGSEDNRGSAYHPGDGGMVAVFMDSNNDIIEVTDQSWKAQTYYTAPIKDLTCLSEDGSIRMSTTCDEDGVDDGTSYYGVHWARPDSWMASDFDDSDWPNASTYTNEEIGVDNKSSYTNYTDVFDDSSNDALFIWSTNVVLDNEVLVRKKID